MQPDAATMDRVLEGALQHDSHSDYPDSSRRLTLKRLPTLKGYQQPQRGTNHSLLKFVTAFGGRKSIKLNYLNLNNRTSRVRGKRPGGRVRKRRRRGFAALLPVSSWAEFL